MLEYSQYPEAADDSIEIGFPLPGADEDELRGPDEDYHDEEIREVNRRSGSGGKICVIMAILAIVAIAALAVGSTFIVQKKRSESIEAAMQSANPPPSPAGVSVTPAPTRTFLGTNLAPTMNGNQENATPLYKGDEAFWARGATTGIGATENVTSEVGVPAQSSVNSSIPPETYLQRSDVAVHPTSAPNLESTEAVTSPPTKPTEALTALTSVSTKADTPHTPEPTEAVTAPPTPEPTNVVTTPLTFDPTKAVTAPPTGVVATVDTPSPTDGPTDAVTAPPTPEPTSTQPTLKPSSRPSSQPTSSPSSLPSSLPSSSQPTSTPSARPSSHATSKPSLSLLPSHRPTFRPSLQPSEERKYCVNIKFTTDNFPGDNGFTFLATKSGEVLHEEKAGFMTKRKSEYLRTICDLSLGSYTLVVTDLEKDGMFTYGKGSYVVDIDGHVVLVGGRFRTNEISHEIIVGVNAIMSETEQGFLDAHNSRRKEFHESQNVSYRPMAWSAELAAGASAWAKEKAKACTNDEGESGMFGQNASSQRLLRPDLARSPDMIVSWWMNGFDPEEPTWGASLRQGSAVLWRTALYVGCAAEIAEIENCPVGQRACYCQVANCRYARTTNCAVKKDNWVQSVIDDNGQLCNPLFCPGADETGQIVEGACHV